LTAIIEAIDLTKTYEGGWFSGQDVHALKDVNFAVDAGEIFGYLGPNGSGKTTTIKMLLGLIFPTSGTMKILGREDIGAPDLRRRIGYLPEGAYYPEFLKGEEILRFYGKLYGLGGKDLETRINQVLDAVRMEYSRKRLLRGYSKGMRQRIGLAQALLSDPDILILDEPTTGLDPLARKEMRDILASLRDEGKTLLVSSHELGEVELISNRVAILYRGQLQVQGTLDELLTDRDLTVEVQNVPAAAQAALAGAGIEVEDRVRGRALLRVPTTMSIYDVMDLCKSNGVEIHSVAPRRETLEELFVRTVGDAAAAEAAGAQPAVAESK
jgi:ABC-2 type transport system ATP-binding protein